jgi:hypothetical protein
MLKIYKENDEIVIEESGEMIKIPYSDAMYSRLQGEIVYNGKEYQINGVELTKIILE